MKLFRPTDVVCYITEPSLIYMLSALKFPKHKHWTSPILNEELVFSTKIITLIANLANFYCVVPFTHFPNKDQCQT